MLFAFSYMQSIVTIKKETLWQMTHWKICLFPIYVLCLFLKFKVLFGALNQGYPLKS